MAPAGVPFAFSGREDSVDPPGLFVDVDPVGEEMDEVLDVPVVGVVVGVVLPLRVALWLRAYVSYKISLSLSLYLHVQSSRKTFSICRKYLNNCSPSGNIQFFKEANRCKNSSTHPFGIVRVRVCAMTIVAVHNNVKMKSWLRISSSMPGASLALRVCNPR